MQSEFLINALSVHLPPILRWAGAIARRLRSHNISVATKTTGSALTDALTLADLTIQELLVAALRDVDPIFRHCRIEAEESTGDLQAFAQQSEFVLALDPIDGTKQYRDHTGNGYAVMLHLRTASEMLYSLVYIPEKGAQGWWVEVTPERVVSGPDDWSRPATDVVRSLVVAEADRPTTSNKIYVIGFQHRDVMAAREITKCGYQGVAPDEMPGSIYELMASGEFAGSLIHSPNVYDFPVSMQIARYFGGNACWTDTGEPVHFRDTWLDEKADMIRLPRVVACANDPQILAGLVNLAKSWHPARYRPGDSLVE